MKFYKMHGAGNDYIFFDCMQTVIENPEELAIKLSRRRFSVGGDGIILLCPSEVADCRMRIFNADGSEGKTCGNGLRCTGKLARDLGYIKGDICAVETLAGVTKLKLFFGKDGKVCGALADMGAPKLAGAEIPSVFSGDRVVGEPFTVNGSEYKITLVSMGNPHCVIFTDPETADVEGVGKAFEKNPAFPEGINCEFVKVTARNRIEMRVWERGSGETLACGTGACAAAVAAVLNGFCDKNTEITVNLRGGGLTVTYTDETVFMRGEAVLAFTGEV